MAQKGNALFLILIAVALFAALSYAITQSGRGGGNISKEKAAIAASQITQFAAGVHTAVQRMVISGVAVNEICYDNTADHPGSRCSAPVANRVFDADGGGVIYECATDEQVTDTSNKQTQWKFRGIYHSHNGGVYVKNIGTNTDISGRDAVAILPSIHLAVCQQINKGLGLAADPTDSTNFSFGNSSSVFTYDESRNVIYSNPGEAFGCVETFDGNSYYHTLIEQ